MSRILQGRMESKAGDTLSYVATRTATCQTNSLSGDRSHQAYLRVRENPAGDGKPGAIGCDRWQPDHHNDLHRDLL